MHTKVAASNSNSKILHKCNGKTVVHSPYWSVGGLATQCFRVWWTDPVEAVFVKNVCGPITGETWLPLGTRGKRGWPGITAAVWHLPSHSENRRKKQYITIHFTQAEWWWWLFSKIHFILARVKLSMAPSVFSYRALGTFITLLWKHELWYAASISNFQNHLTIQSVNVCCSDLNLLWTSEKHECLRKLLLKILIMYLFWDTASNLICISEASRRMQTQSCRICLMELIWTRLHYSIWMPLWFFCMSESRIIGVLLGNLSCR